LISPSEQSQFWLHLTPRTRAWMAFHVVLVITCGLYLDKTFGWTGQHIATVWACGVWAWLYALSHRVERLLLILATLISGAGEVFLSLVWGLYDYQFHNVPLFVPPGHALLMTLGILASRYVKLPVVIGVSGIAAVWAGYAWWTDLDRFGVVLFGMFIGCVAFGRARALYATMFVLALIMELYGTALGNWFWHPFAPLPLPWPSLSQSNPPFSAGAFYAMLDLIVLSVIGFIVAKVHQTKPEPHAQTESAR
jgi:hypothetical protein